MNINGKIKISNFRYKLAITIISIITIFLASRLWYVQIASHQKYALLADKNKYRKVELPAPRGIIFDRNSKILLSNKIFFNLALIPQNLTDKRKTMSVLNKISGMSPKDIEKRIQLYQGLPQYLPVTIKRNLTQHEISQTLSIKKDHPEITLQENPDRDYKYEFLPHHHIGFLGEINNKQLKYLRKKYPALDYRVGDYVGKQGLEATFESFLRGKRGFTYILTDAFGRKVSEIVEKNHLNFKAPIPGSNIVSTIDLELQQATSQAFQNKSGAVVVMDPRNGEILAMTSSPTFDPVLFQSGMSSNEWSELVNDPHHPLIDKTTGGIYPPGSLFKPIVSLFALQEKVVSPQKEYYCPGHFMLGKDILHCHKRGGHGWVNMYEAIIHSCDIYYYEVSTELGITNIEKYGSQMKLGQKIGQQINSELPGTLPSKDWKQKVVGSAWVTGDTPNIAIGQGYLNATPMQMALMYAAIANNGKVYRPQYVKKIVDFYGNTLYESYPEIYSNLNVDEKYFKMIRTALRRVVEDEKGTGHNARIEGFSIGGKTGTVQVSKLSHYYKSELEVSQKLNEHALFAAISPVENAQVVVVVISENDSKGGGGAEAAPIAKKILEKYWQIREPKRWEMATGQQNQKTPQKEPRSSL